MTSTDAPPSTEPGPPGPGDARRTGPTVAVDGTGAHRSRVGAPGRAAATAVWARMGRITPAGFTTFLVVALSSAFVLITLHPRLILTENTPTGGDMGSHVWGPMYLMREVLPDWRLSGWSPDWYAGFPAFQFYMVVPMLAIVALHVGVDGPLLALALVLTAVLAVSGWSWSALHPHRRRLAATAVVLAVLVVPVPYGVSFKLIVVSGLITLPIAAWALGRLADAPFPVPPAFAVGALFFIYNMQPTLNSGTGNIIGGNLTSTMAGEFSFSISLSLAVLYLGVLIRGLRTGRHRSSAAVLLALCGLCHIIPAFYAIVATFLALVIWPGRARLRWLVPVGVTAGLLAAFWVLPFAVRHAFVNDMGWETLPQTDADPAQGVGDYLFPGALLWPLGLAGAGLIVSIVVRRRLGLWLAGLVVLGGVGFLTVPQGRLWNARVLPLFYLAMFLLAALAVAEVMRAVSLLISRDSERPTPWVGIVAGALAFVAALIFLGGPLGTLPTATSTPEGAAQWMGTTRTYRNPGSYWARFNFRGLEGQVPVAASGGVVPEGQGGWPEYRDLVATMDRLGADAEYGCGRAFWEFGSERLNTYGTTMAPMMLPYFTDGCIGSMEGLYFESSATTPYHFLNQCQLSAAGSCSQRDLAYSGFDIKRGIGQLQLMGVKYYMSFSPTALSAAAGDPRLTEVAVSGPWHIYEIGGTAQELVQPLAYRPVVLEGVDDTQGSWLDPAAAWFQDPTRWDVPFARSGPADWPRVKLPEVAATAADGTERRVGDRALPDFPRQAVPRAVVSRVEMGADSLSFRVDRPGTPVLVKVSAFPNWRAEGADGPYRVSPNLMVVVPTGRDVTLTYGRTRVDWLAYALTLLGMLAAIVLAVRPPVPIPAGLLARRRAHRARRRSEAGAASAAAAGVMEPTPINGPERGPPPGDLPPYPPGNPRDSEVDPVSAWVTGPVPVTAASDEARVSDPDPDLRRNWSGAGSTVPTGDDAAEDGAGSDDTGRPPGPPPERRIDLTDVARRPWPAADPDRRPPGGEPHDGDP